jgi:hypothetical protein
VDEVDAGLLAVRDDVDAGPLLLLQPDQRGIFLRAIERRAFVPPRRPEFFRLGEPGRLRQAAGNRGLNMMPPFVVGAPELPRLG